MIQGEINSAINDALNSKVLDGGNIYNYLNDIEGYYINNTSGALVALSTCAVSSVIPIAAGSVVYLSNRTGGSAFRFLDASNNPLKPLTSDGTVFSDYGFQMNGAFKAPPTAVAFQFTTKFTGTTNRVNIIASKRVDNLLVIKDSLLQNSPTIVNLQNNVNTLNNATPAVQAPANAIIATGNFFYFSAKYNSTQNLVKRVDYSRPVSYLTNPNSNFYSEFLATIGADQTVEVLRLKASSDDICPAHVNGSYIAGNHGFYYGYILTQTAHGKTIADVGSVYQNASAIQFVIIRIVDANNLWIISKNQASDGFSYSFALPAGDLTYVSNGVNTATLTGYTTAGVGSLYTTMSQSETKILVDGKTEISAVGTYPCNFIDVMETYSVGDLPDAINKLTSGRPAGGYTSDVFLNGVGADKLFTHSIVYRFLPNGTTLVMHNFRAHKKLTFDFHGFIQATALDSGSLYVPKSLPFDAGNKVYDFRTLEAWTTGSTNAIHLTSAYWENLLSPPDRIVNTNTDVVFHMGYLTDRGVGLSRKDKVADAMFINSSKKLYPMAVSAATSFSIEANSFYSCVAFRQFSNPANNPTGRTNFSWFELDGVVWIFLDYHGSLSDSITSDSSWIGRKIEVYEKNANVLILGDVVASEIEIVSTATATSYGFAVLKLMNQ